MRAGARGRRAGDSHVRGQRLRGDGRAGGRLPAAVPRRVRGRPRGFVPARMPARGDTPAGPVASPRPPGSADSRPGKNDRRDAGGRARLALAGEVRPGQGVPGRAGGLREPDRATGDLACVREAARQRVNAILCRHGMSWDERTPTGRPEKRWGQHFWDWLRPVDLGDAGSQGTASRRCRPPSRPRSPATSRGPGPRGSPGPPTWDRSSTRSCA